MDVEIMKRLTGGNSSKLSNEKILRSSNPTSFTAQFVNVDEVFCLFTGKIEFIGMDEDGLWGVNVAVTNHEIVRYFGMTECYGNKNHWIEEGTKIGKAHKISGFFLEYCSQWKGYSKYPVRVCNRTYYKQNPMDILDGVYTPPREFHLSEQYTRPYQTYEFTPEEREEWYVENKATDLLKIDKSAFQLTDLQSLPKSFIEEFTGSAGGKK